MIQTRYLYLWIKGRGGTNEPINQRNGNRTEHEVSTPLMPKAIIFGHDSEPIPFTTYFTKIHFMSSTQLPLILQVADFQQVFLSKFCMYFLSVTEPHVLLTVTYMIKHLTIRLPT